MFSFTKAKAIDVLLNTICIDIGEKKLIEKLDKIEEVERLFGRYDFIVKNSPEDVSSAVAEFNRLLNELNELLSYSDFYINGKALQELIEYSIKYKKDKVLSKTLDTIFNLINEKRTDLRYEWLTGKSHKIGEVRIKNERWRIYFSCNHGKKEIIGFDYEHKTSNHRDMIPNLIKRIQG